MALSTISGFNYGHTVDEDNQSINFDDGSTTDLAAIEIGSYTLREFGDAIANALTGASDVQEYTVILDRTNNTFTISATSNFDLLIDTGAQKGVTAFTLMGFNGADLTGANSYTSDSMSGSQYVVQFPVSKYVDFDDIQKRTQSTVNESANGDVEVVSYGINNFMECNITLITDITGQGVIRNNASGVSDARNFLVYATNKAPLEFVKDIVNNPTTDITDCIIESTSEDKKGTGFRLKELYAKKLAGYFETGKLTFRAI